LVRGSAGRGEKTEGEKNIKRNKRELQRWTDRGIGDQNQ